MTVTQTDEVACGTRDSRRGPGPRKDLLSIDPLAQQIILGVILLLALGLDAIPRLRT